MGQICQKFCKLCQNFIVTCHFSVSNHKLDGFRNLLLKIDGFLSRNEVTALPKLNLLIFTLLENIFFNSLPNRQVHSRECISSGPPNFEKDVHAVWFYKKQCKISTSAVSYLDLEFQLVSFHSLPPNFNYRFLSYRQRNFYFSYFLKKGQISVHFMITEVL